MHRADFPIDQRIELAVFGLPRPAETPESTPGTDGDPNTGTEG